MLACPALSLDRTSEFDTVVASVPRRGKSEKLDEMETRVRTTVVQSVCDIGRNVIPSKRGKRGK